MLFVQIDHPLTGPERLQRADRLFLTSGTQVAIPADERDTEPLPKAAAHRPTREFTALEAETPCVVRFTDDRGGTTPPLGPFDGLRILGGTIWYGGDEPRPLAHFDDRTHAWYVYPNQALYPGAVLAPA